MRLSNSRTRMSDYKGWNKPMEFKPTTLSKRLFTVIKYGDTRLLEVFMGLFFLVWGSYVMLAQNSFTSSAVFIYISQLMPEWGLGILLITIGLSVLSLSVCDRIKIHRAALLLGHAVWTFLAVFALLGDHTSPAVATYSFVAITMIYLYWRSP